MQEVQAVILNIAFPKSLEEVLKIQHDEGYFDIEYLLANCALSDCSEPPTTTWTVRKWCKKGDIIFFMHSKSSHATISRLKNELKRYSDDYTEDDFNTLTAALERGSELYQKYGGKILAVAQISGTPVYDKIDEQERIIHWQSPLYATVSGYYCLKSPIELSEFNTFITLSTGGAITPVFGKEFEALKALIMSKNAVPRYLEESVAMPIPLAKITGDNWIQVASQYRRSFFLEKQFRAYYVDYLLESLGDRKGFFVECPCIKQGRKPSFADNVIVMDGKYLPVEVKLNIHAEQDLIGQLRKYCAVDALILDKKKNRFAAPDKLFNQGVLTIDTDAVYWYSDIDQSICQIWSLDNVSAKRDILNLREQVISLMRETESGSIAT